MPDQEPQVNPLSSKDGQGQTEPDLHLDLAVEYDPRVNFALQQNDIPVIRALRITNLDAEQVTDIEISIRSDPPVIAPWSGRIAAVDAHSSYNLSDIDIELSAQRLSTQLERERGTILVALQAGGRPVASRLLPFEVLAFNEWSGLRSIPEILAAFVLPNQPSVARLLQQARDTLAKLTGDPALDGYQARDPQRVVAMAGAIYAAVQATGVTYINPPASFEETGQKVRLPDQLMAERMGTCLDLAVLLAAALEQAGLNPILLVSREHAWVGTWLEDLFLPEGCTTDPVNLRKRVDAHEALVFDSSPVATGVSFDRAVAAGRRLLEDSDPFYCAVDILAARKRHIRPLPLQLGPTGWQALIEPTESAAAEVSQVSLPEIQFIEDHRAQEQRESPATRLDRWKAKLLDLSLRNRLLNYKPTSKGSVPLLSLDIGLLEDELAAGQPFRLVPCPDPSTLQGPRSTALIAQRTGEDPLQQLVRESFRRGEIVADLPEGELAKRLVKLFRASRSSLEESGSNTLYLLFGVLVWYESPSSTEPRRAPILLYPVELIRGSMVEPYRIRLTDDDPRINITLLKKLETEFGLDTRLLQELPEDHSGLDIPKIMQRFRQAVMPVKRWEVREEVAISEFFFTKHLMWTDLQERTATLDANPIFHHIMEGYGGSYPLAAPFTDIGSMDHDRPASQELCVVDADSSQLAAVYGAADGNSFVLQGPPGTGKSQTITNLVADLLANGRTVLFVSEKMAALDVVYNRLRNAGLEEFCLELHSNHANKLEAVRRIAAPLALQKERTAQQWAEQADSLQRLREKLNGYSQALHDPGPYGESPYQALLRLLDTTEVPSLQLAVDRPESIARERVVAIGQSLDQVEVASRDVDDPAHHPWRSVAWSDWSPHAQQEIENRMSRLYRLATELQSQAAEAARAAGVLLGDRSDRSLGRLDRLAELLLDAPPPPRQMVEMPDWEESRQRVAKLKETVTDRTAAWEQVEEHFSADLLDLDLDRLALRFRRFAHLFFLIAFLLLFGTRRLLKTVSHGRKLPPNRQIAADLELALTARERDALIEQQAPQAGPILGHLWDGLATDWGAVDRALQWTDAFRPLLSEMSDDMEGQPMLAGEEERRALVSLAIERRELLAAGNPRGAALRTFRESYSIFLAAREELLSQLQVAPGDILRQRVSSLSELLDLLDRWRQALPDLREWCRWVASVREAWGPLTRQILKPHALGQLAGPLLRPAFEKGLAEWWLNEAVSTREPLKTFTGTVHDERIERFRRLDREIQQIARREIRARLASRLPELNAPGEMAVLRQELAKKRRHMPLRKLFARIPHLVTRLKPCVLMSPLSVAQYLDPGLDLFDVVVFDEASQIPPWDAIGAIARGKQVVVVGDSKQLPPTTFFQKEDGDEPPADEEIEELESILDECVRAGFPTRSLRWHYRSRHETLIAFSNYHYYGNSLYTFPATDQAVDHLGVKWRHVPDGFYDRAGTRANQGEASAVVAEIERRLADAELSKKSIGVVTFSQAQQHLIEDLLDDLRLRRPELERFFTRSVNEPVFVKNLENVQGDERDVMLFSVCYGPDQAGRLTMNFGPLNRQGGERRLNVAITRARELLIVFSRLTPDQIDLARTQATGAAHLKTFLTYAQQGLRAINEAVVLDPKAAGGTPLEREIADKLRQEGWQVDHQVGCAGYRIDLAVKDPQRPGSYLLGIECDGATYHSAKTARDRDRIRQAVLESLGWRLFRIWSLDWWHAPQRIMERLQLVLQTASCSPRRSQPAGAATPAGPALPAPSAPTPQAESPQQPAPTAPTAQAESPRQPAPATGPMETRAPETPSEPAPSKAAPPPSPTGQPFPPLAAPHVPTSAPIPEQADARGTPSLAAYPPEGKAVQLNIETLLEAAAAQPALPPNAHPYRRAEIPLLGARELWATPTITRQAAIRLAEAIRTEAPIHQDEATRRVGASWELERISKRSVDFVRQAARLLPQAQRPVLAERFFWRPDQDPTSWREFRVPSADDPESRRDADHLCPQEVANAAAWVVGRAGAITGEDLIAELARLFGFGRMGTRVRAAMAAGIQLLQRTGRVQKVGDSYRPV